MLHRSMFLKSLYIKPATYDSSGQLKFRKGISLWSMTDMHDYMYLAICDSLSTLSQRGHGDQQKEYSLLHHPPCVTVNYPLARYFTDLNDESGVGI